ncbi:MAG: flagellar biosynthesis anti-sigma factor FlgM [Candidatus Omnitrophica bacterium]|nr:flagellar biosynthesis anti-sigma factor FlgM [Candidatus Omnitrophota bacterium]
MTMQHSEKNQNPFRPPLNVTEAEYLLEAVMRLKKEMEFVPEPNEGRIQEIKNSIKNGTFLTDEMIDEVAEKMANIFLRRNRE